MAQELAAIAPRNHPDIADAATKDEIEHHTPHREKQQRCHPPQRLQRIAVLADDDGNDAEDQHGIAYSEAPPQSVPAKIYEIRVHICFSTKASKVSRTVPSKNCITAKLNHSTKNINRDGQKSRNYS